MFSCLFLEALCGINLKVEFGVIQRIAHRLYKIKLLFASSECHTKSDQINLCCLQISSPYQRVARSYFFGVSFSKNEPWGAGERTVWGSIIFSLLRKWSPSGWRPVLSPLKTLPRIVFGERIKVDGFY